ncbi:Pterin-4-alpha-carbinolamine dehydratase [Devosia sp. H5989]|uniref:Putative pterin-4-alpha-carbinolamine dehydratase n=1 Tax=Paradevosia tibetensis TaxID=1447062 RepID=A0A5B9DVH8_9HYPH|nr:4a-hydroxytetrahydrobiopterin dehydratase [Youhaiella tibetensis]AKR57499.1 Pterin-4-alpha-carbinolamine dehydratase [Devosia sp. H5989]QEE22428.1 4a-hydroxytetrahydrobiopterin dehydratase [Youhaiella tibetensis]
MADLIAEAERNAALAEMPWDYDEERKSIFRSFGFRDFSEAFAFMTRVALLAEKAGHHPDWSNSYNVVAISLSTHDAGGVTRNDIELARRIDALIE